MRSPIGVSVVRLGDGPRRGDAVAVEARRPVVHTVRATAGVVVDVGLPHPPRGPVVAAPR